MTPVEVLGEAAWHRRREAHLARVATWTGPHRERKRTGTAHPVLDFLFSYYSHRPSHLERWHPGPGVALTGPSARDLLDRRGHVWVEVEPGVDAVVLDPATLPDGMRRTAGFVRALVGATAARAPRLSCFGLHEWAMVYRSGEVRHESWPLRLGGDGTDAVVESLPLRCTHHDAFRFFTDAARPRNATAPRREDQVEREQPGCVHAGMDLYKWAYKLAPAAPAELVADCFAFAVRARELDMCASPYDLAALGYEPVPIETAAGRATYAAEQARLAEAAAPLRRRLLDLCDTLLATP